MAEAPSTARQLSSTSEGVSPRRRALPDAGRRSFGVCRLPAARTAVPHRQSRHRVGCATQPDYRAGWDRAPNLRQRRACARGLQRPGSEWRPSAAGTGGVPHGHCAVQRRGWCLGVAVSPRVAEARAPGAGGAGRGGEVSRATRHRWGGRVRRGVGSRSVVLWSGGAWWGGGWRGVKAQLGASSRAQQGRAGDGFQLPLRFSFQPRLTPSVRLQNCLSTAMYGRMKP
jgi:hypothetical protein